MNAAASQEALSKSVARYPVYLFFHKASYWGPVFFLYFSSLLSLADVLLLEAIYYVSVVILEVPTGYLADRFGSRRILIASSIAQMAACSAFALSGHFFVLAAGQTLLALGMSLSSGSDTAYHFAVIGAANRQDEFPEREGRAARALLLSQATSALVGGCVAVFDLRLAYLLTLVSSLVAASIAYRFAEVSPGREQSESVTRQLKSCIKDVRNPRLAWLLGFYIYMTVVNHIPHEFYQPFIRGLIDQAAPGVPTPAVTGIHTALTMGVATLAATLSIRLTRRIGNSWTLLLGGGIQTLIIGAMASLHSPVVAILVLLRSVPRGLMYAPLNAEIVPLIGEGRRATYLSLQSLLGRLAFGGVLIAFSRISSTGNIAEPLSLSTVGAVAGLLLLAITAPLSFRASSRASRN
jgi:hypothetical protein